MRANSRRHRTFRFSSRPTAPARLCSLLFRWLWHGHFQSPKAYLDVISDEAAIAAALQIIDGYDIRLKTVENKHLADLEDELRKSEAHSPGTG